MSHPLANIINCRHISIDPFIDYFLERLEQELKQIPEWAKYWRKLQKIDRNNQRDPVAKEQQQWERRFLQNLIINFYGILDRIPKEGEIDRDLIQYCERFLELIIDLEALLPTRRFFNTILDDCHLLVRVQLSNLVQRPEGKLFGQVSENSYFILNFISFVGSIYFLF